MSEFHHEVRYHVSEKTISETGPGSGATDPVPLDAALNSRRAEPAPRAQIGIFVHPWVLFIGIRRKRAGSSRGQPASSRHFPAVRDRG